MSIANIGNRVCGVALLVASLLLYSCGDGGRNGYGVSFSDELKYDIEKEMDRLPESRLRLAAKITTPNPSDTIYIRGLIANRLMSVKMRHEANFTKAITYARTAYDRAVLIEDTVEIVKNLNELGTNYRRIGALTDALEYHYKALAIASVYHDSTSIIALKNLTYAYNGVGNIALSMHNYDEAKRCFLLGLKLEDQLGSQVGMAINYANLGSIMQKEEKYDSAFYYYSKSYETNLKCGSSLGVALCHNHFGSLYELQNKLDSAKIRYRQSYDMLLTSSDKWHWLVSCVSLGRVCLKMNNLNEAEEYLVSARDIATHTDAAESLEEAHELLASLYRRKGNLKAALAEVEHTIELNETIRRGLQNNTFNNAQMMYLRDKAAREHQIQMEKAAMESERRSTWNKINILVVIVIIVVVTHLVITFRRIRSRNNLVKSLQNSRNRVFSIISSEVKTPAVEQRDELRYLVENIDSLSVDEQKQHLMQIYTIAVKQVEQLNSLQTWAHIQMGYVKPNIQAINLCQLVTSSIDMLSLAAKQKNINFDMPYDNSKLVSADSEMLSCVMLNLLTYAIKLSLSGGEVVIRYKDEAFFTMLYIEEHGVVLSEEQIATLLERKSDIADVDTDADVSSAIGMRICVELINRCNGSLSIERRVNRGSTFVLTLPKPNK
ncbi:MAG: tetratricopeptide repeat-containing sensor histidine kinase [Bacteroidia bacterium]|nr:tetratricopeptide repeat-containing sensor histidine kinase [Bacteroidia bacterium]